MESVSSTPRQQVVYTWNNWRTSQSPRLLHDAWPRVLPTTEGAAERVPVQSRTTTQAWLAALAAFDELRTYRDLPTLLRRAVELLREAIGLERAAVFLLNSMGDSGQQTLSGTFGTGPSGETTDERHIAFELGESHREAFALARNQLAQWSRFSAVPLFAQCDDRTVVLRNGENVIVPIPGTGGALGLIACDWALSGRHSDTDALIRAAVFTRILGPELERLAAADDPSARPDPCLRSVSVSHDSQLAADAVRRLQVNPNESRAELAKHLATSADHVGRAFKAVLGESIQDYRNRLRLERFLAIVDPAGGDLLAAALDAGFGSYAQFHRVFRRRFACAPIEYLRQHRT